MVGERRFLIASSFARLIERESRTSSRIVEGHFPPHPERFQLVRVERERAVLILAHRQEDRGVAEEIAEIPRAHAEALIDVAAGTVAFDRVVIELGGGRKALLDRFLLPRGIDVLTTTREERAEAHLPEWFGAEVTDRPEFETASLAVNGIPSHAEVEITGKGLEALLDILQGRSTSPSYMRRPIERVRLPTEPQASSHEVTPQEGAEPDLAETPATPEADQTNQPNLVEHRSAEWAEIPSDMEQESSQAEAGGAEPGAQEAALSPLPHQPPRGRQARVRGNVQLDESIARIARSLAPRDPRPPR